MLPVLLDRPLPSLKNGWECLPVLWGQTPIPPAQTPSGYLPALPGRSVGEAASLAHPGEGNGYNSLVVFQVGRWG